MTGYSDLSTVDNVCIDFDQDVEFVVDGFRLETADGHALPMARIVLPIRVAPFNQSDDRGRPLPPLKLCLTGQEARRLGELLFTSIVQVEALIAGIDPTGDIPE